MIVDSKQERQFETQRRIRVGHIWVRRGSRIGHIRPRDLAGYLSSDKEKWV
ncbi:MAG: hypothetical protein QXR44_01055 [Thermoproteota archaeon]